MAKFDRRWFNPLYFHLIHYCADDNIRKIMIYGGKSSSKTFSIAQFLAIKTYTENCSSICYRKEQVTIKNTLKQSINKAISSVYMDSVYEIQDFKYLCANGQNIVLKGLDAEDKVKGIEGYKYLLFDELDHFTKEEWRQANLSLRGQEGQKLLATWNPIDEDIWIKKDEIDKQEWVVQSNTIKGIKESKLHDLSKVLKSKDGKTILIKTTYFDNKWVTGSIDEYGFYDKNLVAEYDKLKLEDFNSYNVNVLGNWGIRNKSKKFCYAWNDNVHIGKTEYNSEYILDLSFDFNVNPIVCTAFQHIDGHIYGIRTIKLDNSNIYKLCDNIKAYYPNAIYRVTGDSTGKNNSALVDDSINYYTVIMSKLSLVMNQMLVPTKNPRIEENQLLVNSMLINYPITIDEHNCEALIFDCRYVEIDANKSIIKNRTSEERKADALDTFRYYLNTYFKNYLRK